MSQRTPGDFPAFPVPCHLGQSGDSLAPFDFGMSLRQYYAGLAMQGILASWPANSRALDGQATAETAVKFADALIVALEAA